MTKEFNVGDKVTVVNPESIFDRYQEWATANGLSNFTYSKTVDVGGEYTVITKAPHEYVTAYGIIYGIRGEDGNEYIAGADGIELIKPAKCNGVDAKGNPLNFTVDMLKPFMRVRTYGVEYAIVVPYAGGVCLCFERETWNEAYFEDRDTNNHIVAVYDVPDRPWQALNCDEVGRLLWEAKQEDDGVVTNDFSDRLAYFQQHIDAVQENLESLKKAFNDLKEEVIEQ